MGDPKTRKMKDTGCINCDSKTVEELIEYGLYRCTSCGLHWDVPEKENEGETESISPKS